VSVPHGHAHARFTKAHLKREIANCYLQGWLQSRIAAHLEVTQPTVSRYLRQIHDDWLCAAQIDFDAAKAEQLARLDHLERTYWDAWERSKEQRESSIQEQIQGETSRLRAQIRKDQDVGDARFLQGVERCIDQRCKILGLYAPVVTHERSAAEGVRPLFVLGGSTSEYLRALEQFADGLEQRQLPMGEA
jgi:predicted transcriptional regulator